MATARALDPLQAMHHALSAQVAFLARDYRAALGFAQHARVVMADFWIANLQIAQAYEGLGEYERALETLSRAGVGSENSKVISLKVISLRELQTCALWRHCAVEQDTSCVMAFEADGVKRGSEGRRKIPANWAVAGLLDLYWTLIWLSL